MHVEISSVPASFMDGFSLNMTKLPQRYGRSDETNWNNIYAIKLLNKSFIIIYYVLYIYYLKLALNK